MASERIAGVKYGSLANGMKAAFDLQGDLPGNESEK